MLELTSDRQDARQDQVGEGERLADQLSLLEAHDLSREELAQFREQILRRSGRLQ